MRYLVAVMLALAVYPAVAQQTPQEVYHEQQRRIEQMQHQEDEDINDELQEQQQRQIEANPPEGDDPQ